MTIRLECVEGGASKFWEASVEDKTLTTTWGKLGTAGQSKSKPFASAAAAQAEYDKLVREKRGKGYVHPKGASPAAAAAAPPKASGSKASQGGGKSPPAASAEASGASAVRRCTTDAGILVLFDAAHFPTVVDYDTWEKELLEGEDIARHVAAGHMVPLSTGADGAFRIEARVGPLTDAEKKAVAKSSSAYLLVVDKAASFGGIEFVHESPDPRSVGVVAAAKGRWSVTVHELAGKKWPDVLVLLEPAAEGQAFRTAATPYDPKPKEPFDPKAPLRTWKKAAEAARHGAIAPAVHALVSINATKPEPGSVAALAEIRAYEGDWPAFFALASQSLEMGTPIGNTRDEFLWLLLRGGHATGDWEAVKRALARAKDVAAYTIAKHIKKQIAAKGTLEDPSFDLLFDDERKAPLATRQKRYDDAMSGGDTEKPSQRAESLFFCASNCGLDDLALENYEKGEQHMRWDYAFSAAVLYARRGDKEKAWATLVRKLPVWWALSYAQIAPLDLLCDENIAPLMTPERRALVLATPRS